MFVETKFFHKAGEGSGGGGGGDSHNKGSFLTPEALRTAYPTAEPGDFAIVESTDTVWVWDSDTSNWKDGDTKGQVTSVNGQTGAVTVDALPSQTGQSGKFLTTNGTDASWSDKPLVNTATGDNSLSVLGNVATYTNSVNIGKNTNITGFNAVAVGYGAGATQQGTGLGSVAKANGQASVAIGLSAVASANKAIQLGGGTNSDANTFKVANTNGNYEMMSADGTIPTARLPNAINKYSTMPTAASTNEGWIVQFTGTTDSTYTHGHLYECVSDGQDPATYSWTEVSMGGGSGLPSQTGNAGKFLTTDGTDASWSDKPLVNEAVTSYSIGIGSSIPSGKVYSICIGKHITCNYNSAIVIGSGDSVNSGKSGSIVIAPNGSFASVGTASFMIGVAAGTIGDDSIYIGKQNGGSVSQGGSSIYLGCQRYSATTIPSGVFAVGFYQGVYTIVDKYGEIPTDRFTTTPVADGTYVPTLTISSGVATRSWAAGLPAMPTTAGTYTLQVVVDANGDPTLSWV